MNIPVKPTRVLCKRTYSIGKNHWWDENASPPVRHAIENREMIEGTWYDVVENPKDSWDPEKSQFWFSIIDHKGKLHSFKMYTQEDRVNWHDACVNYGPHDYSKWFYTPEELEQREKGTFVLIEDVFIKPGNHHWVRDKEDNWIIARCDSKHPSPGKFYWTVIGSNHCKVCFDFKEIGEQIVSYKKQKEQKEKEQALEELTDELATLLDAINKPDPDREYPSVEYVAPFVNNAWDKYMDVTWKHLGDFFNNTFSEDNETIDL